MEFTQRVAANVKLMREQVLGSVEQASARSYRRFGPRGISVPRWYRLEQGKYPGMIGEVIDTAAKMLGVDPAVLGLDPSVLANRKNRKDFLRPVKKRRRKAKRTNGNGRKTKNDAVIHDAKEK